MPKKNITVYLSSDDVKKNWEKEAKKQNISLSVFIEKTVETALKGESDEISRLKNELLNSNKEISKLKDLVIDIKRKEVEKQRRPAKISSYIKGRVATKKEFLKNYYSELQESTMNTKEFEEQLDKMNEQAMENNLIDREWMEMTKWETDQVRKLVDSKNIPFAQAIKIAKKGRTSTDFDMFFGEELRGWNRTK